MISIVPRPGASSQLVLTLEVQNQPLAPRKELSCDFVEAPAVQSEASWVVL